MDLEIYHMPCAASMWKYSCVYLVTPCTFVPEYKFTPTHFCKKILCQSHMKRAPVASPE